MVGDSWTHRLARAAVRPLVGSFVTPNHLTTLRLLTGLAACACFAAGSRAGEIWGGVLWVVSAFLDRADGELARLANTQSRWGHIYDYASDVSLSALFFVSIGIGASGGFLGPWAVALGLLGGATVALASLLSEAIERHTEDGIKAYEGRGGFDFDDVLYLFGPIAWLGWLTPLLIGGSLGGPAFALWTWLRYRRL